MPDLDDGSKGPLGPAIFLAALLGRMVLALVGLSVVLMTLWFCAFLIFEPAPAGYSRFDNFAIAYALGFVAVLLGFACVRLAIPSLRTKQGGILDPWSLRVLATIYAVILVVGAYFNPDVATLRLAMVVLVLLIVAAVRTTFGWPPRGPHGRGEDDSRPGPYD